VEKGFLSAVLRRDRLLVVGALVVVVAMAWGWLLAGAGMDMSALEMTAMAGMDGWLMQPAVWTPIYAVLVFTMWWVMMVAMMLPSAAPTLLLFARINHRQEAGSPLAPTAFFAIGYLLAWGSFGIIATALQWGLETARLLSPMLSTGNRWLGAGILVAAGLWQLTRFKTVCLRHCRTPLGFLVGNWQDGRFGALRMGIAHGAFCVGCCWFLMVLLFFGGVMNLYWIAGLAVFVLLEKTLPFGHRFGRMAGIALVATGTVLALQPY
jgi:predicted metal-binding membrane protein